MKFTAKQMIPFIVSLTMFMESVDATVINTAIPAMAHSLNVNPIDLKIALISYLVSLAIFIPISGWFADKFGIKKVFIVALMVFTASSLWCGFAHNLTTLVIARCVQGMGSSFGVPVGRLIIVRAFPRQNLIDVMSRVIMVAALGIMLGPVLGGFITHYWSWHWIFWINIPVGLCVIALAQYYLDDSPPQKVPPLDKIGFLLFGCALAGLTFGTSALSETTVKLSYAISILLASIFLLILYFLSSRKKSHPVVKTDLLQIKTFRISVMGNLLFRIGIGGVPFLVPLLLQISLGYSADLAGLMLAPTAIGIVVAKPCTLPVLRTLGFRRTLLLNSVLAMMVVWLFILVNQNTPLYLIATISLFYGFLAAMQYGSMNSLAYADLPEQYYSAATSIMGTIQQLGVGFGVAVCALVIRIFSSVHPDFVLTQNVFRHTFFVVGLIILCGCFVYVRLSSEDGNQLLVIDENKLKAQ